MSDVRARAYAPPDRQKAQPQPEPPRPKTSPAPSAPKKSKRNLYFLIGIGGVIAAVAAWYIFKGPALPPGFADGNGRLEANQVFVSTKYPGRVLEVLFNEGDTVEQGQVVARMDTSALDAQLREALAQIKEAQDSRDAALAQVQVRQAEYNYAQKEYARSRSLVGRGAVSGQEAEIDFARSLTSKAQLVSAQADATRASSTIDAATATADRLRAEIRDATLVAPIRGRIESRLSEPGEVLPAGGRVFSVNNLADVYMYVFLPEAVSGKVKLGSEARIVLDSAPDYPIRAYVSYVSPIAQFTPKSVETAEERHNLTFRVKLQIDPQRLRQYEAMVKSGLPGMGYVRFDDAAQWPPNLQVKTNVPQNLWERTGSAPGPTPAPASAPAGAPN